MGWRVGVDVGGTFTDLVACDDAGASLRFKVPSTPRAPEDGFLNAFRLLLREVAPERIAIVTHAGTIATNALLGQLHLALPRVAFVTTEGFRDVLEIGRQARASVYDLNVRRPRPLALREDRLTVRERIDFDGSVHEPLDPASVERVASTLAERAIGSVAVGLLNSYVNDVHERAVVAALRTALPNLPITGSAELVREEREYERFSTAVVNAALLPIVRGYLERLAHGLRELRVAAPLFVMQSNGGSAALAYVACRPAAMIESGPASGAIAAAALGAALGLAHVLSFDMGGTTAKAGTIVDGVPALAYEFEAAGATHSGRTSHGSGYPVRFPFVDLAEVSAGGGTIAWLDEIGALRVGPLSAGADPGPACYGIGLQATVTDANVVLGRLNPAALLGGTFPIDAARARAAVAAVATPLDGDVEATAAGIVTLIDSAMAKVLRIVSVERGLDPRDFTLIAFGGGGPLHGCALAEELAIRHVVIPPAPGLFSALGLLTADVRVTLARSLVRPLDAAALDDVRTVAGELEGEALVALAEHGVPAGDRRVEAELDLRYVGQSYDLTVPLGTEPAAVAAAFHARHERRYGYAAPSDSIEIAALRVTGIGAVGAAPPVHLAGAAASASEAQVGERRAWDNGAFVAAAVYERERLGAGATFAGPAIVEQYDTTTWLPPDWRATVDATGNLLLHRT